MFDNKFVKMYVIMIVLKYYFAMLNTLWIWPSIFDITFKSVTQDQGGFQRFQETPCKIWTLPNTLFSLTTVSS